MKKVFSIILVLALAAVCFVGAVSGLGVKAEAATEKLVVYNWGDYIDPNVEADFEAYYFEQTGKSLDLIYSTFDTNEIMLTTLEKGDERIDLICPSEYAIERLMKKGLIQELDMTKISNVSNVNQSIYAKVDEVFPSITVDGAEKKMSSYFVPYMMGTLGILYNKNYVTEADLAKGYGLLWNANGNEKLNGKILMKDSIRDSYVAAVLYLKETDRLPDAYKALDVQTLINTVDDTLLNAAEEVLKEQGKALKGYEVDFGKGQMTSGRAYVDLAWSGDALWAMEDADFLDYYIPEIGGNIWFDGWVMPKNASNSSAAYAFLEYLCRPEISMRNSMEIGYTSAIAKDVVMGSAEALQILADNEYDADEFFNNEIRYPTQTQKLGVMKDFGNENEAAVAMWERVKSSNQSFLWILWVVLGIAGAAGIAVGVYFILKKKKNSRRKRA